MTPLQRIRQIIIKNDPSILDLVFGCEGIWKPHGKVIILHNPPDMMRILNIQYVDGRFVTTGAPAKAIEIIGRTITLSDVLRAIGTKTKKDYKNGDGEDIFGETINEADVQYERRALGLIRKWNSKDNNLNNQSKECHKSILKILT